MGWWSAGPSGQSLVMEETGMLWGDEPADIMGDAVQHVVQSFEENVGRRPTLKEIRSGLEFALGIYNEDGSNRYED